MLSRTADHLYWMSRYMERAENTARLLDVNYQTAMLAQSARSTETAWRGLLSLSELTEDFERRHQSYNACNIIDFMVRDTSNVSSIYNCLYAARENARAIRGVLTTEVWEMANQSWLEFRRLLETTDLEKNPSELFEWVKFRSHLSRGVTLGTMLQDASFYFMRIGTFLERADNTARLLDVKFQGVAPEFFGSHRAPESPEIDFYHWSSVLRSVSAFEIYRKVYRNVIQPDKVAELLILREDMPRSLLYCVKEVVHNLDRVANEHSLDTQRLAGRLRADLQFNRIDEILSTGLHAFLTQFLNRISHIGTSVSRDFLVPAH